MINRVVNVDNSKSFLIQYIIPRVYHSPNALSVFNAFTILLIERKILMIKYHNYTCLLDIFYFIKFMFTIFDPYLSLGRVK